MILRPRTLHYPVEYPSGIAEIAASGKRAVRLLRPAALMDVSEPVLVMENFDALHHRNYYHWLILLLTRINHVKQQGLLSGRKLLVPAGLKGWMLASCAAIGVTEADMLVAPADTELRLTDTLLISSVEFASPVLLQGLCDTLIPDTGAPATPEEPLHIFISRKGQTRRPFLNEAEIESIAREFGFTIVQPETLSFTEQVRLFRRAAGVAGPEGAAFANTIFCKPGARILTMLNENDLFPTFNDLASVMGLKHRKLAGKAMLDGYGANFLWAPYRVDPALAARDLRWTLEG